ncbi:Cycloheximide resistance protein [Phlyctema vagabunda]|uniref:Cycloheximide resistance protein n=1 Tax=Phlyctema vagabunda TaxID=108571 RepID=A0ABR4PGD7_9HELO
MSSQSSVTLPAGENGGHNLEEGDMEYRYLTFDTYISSLSQERLTKYSEAGHTSPPRPPDLKPYISPFLWSSGRKNAIVWLGVFAAGLASHAAGSYTSAATEMAKDWGIGRIAVMVGVTTFTTGFAVAPMLLAPFSEINGRYPVFICAGLLFVIGQICCAVTRSYAGMLVARFVTGVGSSVFSSMVGGVISDLYKNEERNTPMALFSLGALFGTGTGPLCSGFIVQRTDWRWVFWSQAIANGVLVSAFALCYRETRGEVLLKRKARSLNLWYDELELRGYKPLDDFPLEHNSSRIQRRYRWQVKSATQKKSFLKMITLSLYRPFRLLFTEPILFSFSLWVTFAWAVLYITFSSIPIVFAKNHDFDLEQGGAVFTSICVGSLLAVIVELTQQKLFPNVSKVGSETAPERRLYFTCVEGVLLPAGLFWFGWTQFSSIPWIVPALGVGCATMGIFWIYLSTFNYLADIYQSYASSALAAQSFCRNLVGGIFPLVTPALFNNLGFQEASSLLGGIAVLLTLVPWLLVLRGPTIRSWSKYTV